MNLELFISKRITKSKKKSFSTFIIKIAIVAVALSISVIIISNAVVTGFQNEIKNKLFNFWGHIHITNYDSNISFEPTPINKNQDFYPAFDSLEGIRHIQSYATKAGIIKTKGEIEGIVLKGIDSDFDWDFLKSKIEYGTAFLINDSITSNNMLISQSIASRLQLHIGEKVNVYFIQNPPRARKFNIAGIYKTGLEEYDKLYCIIDIKHIQKLNDWKKNQIGGFEIFIDDIDNLEELGNQVYENIAQDLYAQTLKEINPNIFDWLEMQNLNKYVILGLMILVAGINMITVLLVLILERTNMIGTLKALGCNNRSIQTIFLYHAVYIIGIGLLAGNIFGIGLCLLQKNFELISLPEISYYVNTIPIQLNWASILITNLCTIAICTLMLLLPSYLIAKITPVKAIRFN